VVAGQIPAGVQYGENDVPHRLLVYLATMVGLRHRLTGEMKDNKGKPIYFDSIDNSAYILEGRALRAQVVDCISWRDVPRDSRGHREIEGTLVNIA